jgi:hypothetical protein
MGQTGGEEGEDKGRQGRREGGGGLGREKGEGLLRHFVAVVWVFMMESRSPLINI